MIPSVTYLTVLTVVVRGSIDTDETSTRQADDSRTTPSPDQILWLHAWRLKTETSSSAKKHVKAFNSTIQLYVLHTAPGGDQYLLGSRQAAVANAVAFAKREGVRAWLTDEGYGCALLEDSRVVDSI